MLREAAMAELCKSCQLGMDISCEHAGALRETREQIVSGEGFLMGTLCQPSVMQTEAALPGDTPTGT